MNTPEVKNNNITWTIVKYVFGILGILGIVLAILTVTDNLDFLPVDFRAKYLDLDERGKLITSLSSSILGILFIFIAFSKQIDAFFNVIERKELKLSKSEEKEGLSIELIFFLIIGISLIVLAVLMGIGYLTIRTELPLLGGFTEKFLIGSLVVLAILAFITAFNEIIGKSLKEMKKVHWPTSTQMSKFSAQVFAFIIFFSILFYGLDVIIDNSLTALESLIG